MLDGKRSAITWIDVLWLVFLGGLALLPPVFEIHKQLVLLGIVAFQLFEGRLIQRLPERGPLYSVAFKILLATLLLDHTGDLGINSSYYPIYFLPVVSAAIFFGPLVTLLWTSVASLAYLSLLIPALRDYELTSAGATILITRVLFFFIAAMLVNRFVMENRGHTQRLELLSEKLAETNRQLRLAEADARRADRLAALGQLSAGLAHEIRNPLGVIKGSAEMLNKKLKDDQPVVAELAGYISSEVNRLNALVGRFLDFARPSRLELREESIVAIVEAAIEAVQASIREEHVTIVRNYAPDLPKVQADRQLCEQVFVNLITNAVQAMREQNDAADKTVKISIAADTLDSEPGVCAMVEDSGPGVPPELREQIFNPFFTSKKDGVGLGLSIVAKIVDDHRGTIQLDQSTTRGARFSVFLPQARAA